MPHPKIPSEDDPAQLPVEPEFPVDAEPGSPQADEGFPGSDESAAGFATERL